MKWRSKTIDNKPDWTISEAYEKSWQAVKKHKVLWIFGMAVAGLSGTQYNFSNSSNSFSKVFQQSPQHSEKVSSLFTDPNVLGASTDLLAQTLSSISPLIWILLIAGGISVIILTIIVGLVSSSWAQASLLQAIQTALGNQTPTIRDSSEKAFPSFKSMIWLQIVPALIFFVTSFLIFIVLVSGLTFGGALKTLFILLLIAAGLAFLYGLIMLTLTQIWAPRIAVLAGKSGRQSFHLGFIMTRKKFWPMLGLGLVNTILSAFVVGVPIVVVAGLVIGGALLFVNLQNLSSISPGLIALIGLIFLILIFGYMLLSGILTAFKAGVWSVCYNNIKGKYHAD